MNKKLVPIFNEKVQKYLYVDNDFKKDYIREFISSYLELEIEDITMLKVDELLNDRIHFTFNVGKIKYYYELKFSVEKGLNNFFDFSFMNFIQYCFKNDGEIRINQLIINFEDDIDHEDSIKRHIITNKDIYNDHKIKIDIINVNNLMKEYNSINELTNFKRWILLFSLDTVIDTNYLTLGNKIMEKYIYDWHYMSNIILKEERALETKELLVELLNDMKGKSSYEIAVYLLKKDVPLELIMKTTNLSIDEIIKLRE